MMNKTVRIISNWLTFANDRNSIWWQRWRSAMVYILPFHAANGAKNDLSFQTPVIEERDRRLVNWLNLISVSNQISKRKIVRRAHLCLCRCGSSRSVAGCWWSSRDEPGAGSPRAGQARTRRSSRENRRSECRHMTACRSHTRSWPAGCSGKATYCGQSPATRLWTSRSSRCRRQHGRNGIGSVRVRTEVS